MRLLSKPDYNWLPYQCVPSTKSFLKVLYTLSLLDKGYRTSKSYWRSKLQKKNHLTSVTITWWGETRSTAHRRIRSWHTTRVAVHLLPGCGITCRSASITLFQSLYTTLLILLLQNVNYTKLKNAQKARKAVKKQWRNKLGQMVMPCSFCKSLKAEK